MRRRLRLTGITWAKGNLFFVTFSSTNLDKYPLEAQTNLTVFEFVSQGPNGPIPKLIQFQQINQSPIYNLAFGNKNGETGEIDDLAVSNNGDTQKVLATVVAALYAFLDNYPEAYVYATGSTTDRTRLYRMGITRFYEEVVQDFELYGQIGSDRRSGRFSPIWGW